MTDIRPQLLTLKQVAIILQCHINTVRNYLAEGKLKGHNPNRNRKGLRVTVESLRDFLKRYELESFNEKEFDEAIDRVAMQPTVPKSRSRRGWVKSW